MCAASQSLIANLFCMAGNTFEEEQKLRKAAMSKESSGGMAAWLVRKGLAANQTSADLTLVVLAIAAAGLALYIGFSAFARPVPLDDSSEPNPDSLVQSL
jgi:hypothetical protein